MEGSAGRFGEGAVSQVPIATIRTQDDLIEALQHQKENPTEEGLARLTRSLQARAALDDGVDAGADAPSSTQR